MSKTDLHLPFSWKQHVYYWIGIVLIWVLFSLAFEGIVWEPFVNKLGYLPSQLLIVYFFLYRLLPLLGQRAYISFSIGFIIMAYVATVLARFMKIYFYETLTGYDSEKESILEILTEQSPLLIQYFIWVFLTPALTIIAVLIFNHYKQQETLAKLKNQRSQSELQFLRAQLHPHFLFNTLNNLYTLALQKSPMTSKVAQRLYDILNHMFHQANQQWVRLDQELELVANYIELEKLRYGDRLKIDMQQDIIDTEQSIIPLMILSLVENAFKHGASKDPGEPKIAIDIREKNGWLDCVIRNTVPTLQQKDETGYTKGIGTDNIKRQLQILYPSKHNYQVTESNGQYQVHLRLNQKSK